jgi:hypothetical protein
MSQKIRIKLKSYDHNLVDKSAEKIVRTVKATGAAVSGPPVLSSKTGNSITVSTVTIPVNPGNQAVEYAPGFSGDLSGAALESLSWQSGTTFMLDGLTGATLNVYVYARSAENVNYTAGGAQVSAVIEVTITGIDGLPQAKTLIAQVHNGRLYVDGLIPGQAWRVVNATGRIIYINVAEDEKADISLPLPGVYIVWSDNRAVKIINK